MRKMKVLPTKVCYVCGIGYPEDTYPKHPKMKSGRLNKCRECCKKSAKESREKNLEVVRAYDRVRSKSPERKFKKKIYQSGKGKELANARKREHTERYPKRKAANTAVGNAIRDGRLIPQPCFICGCPTVQGHHPDYDSPLDVVWLCIPHHNELHSKYNYEDDLKIAAKYFTAQ